MSVETFRAELPAVADHGRIHLNNCSASPIPERVIQARRDCEQVWIEAANPWDAWLERVDDARGRFADLIGTDPENVAVFSCATAALTTVASAFDYDDRSEVVISDLDFPTIPQFWAAQERRGVHRRWAESPDGTRVPTDRYEAAMNDDTLMVCSGHATSFTGGLMDVEAVADAVHDRGGYLFLDAYQSAGVVPIDVVTLGVDFLVSGTLKFLFGGPGIAFLYVDQEVADRLEPASRGWFAVDDVFGFETRDPAMADGARRFQLGTPPATNAYAAHAGLSFVAEFGVDRIRDRVLEHTARLIDGLDARDFEVKTPRDDALRGGVVNVQVADPEAAERALVDDGFCLSVRAGGLRLSPHFYNTAEEIDRAIEAVAEVADPR